MKQVNILKIHVVNLKRSTKRRSDMLGKFESLQIPFEFFDAVDGRSEKHRLFERYNKELALKRYGFELAPGELGCYASHFLLWQLCIETRQSILILEDDIEFSVNFKQAYEFASQKINNYGLLRLSGHKPRKFAVCEGGDDLKVVRFKRGPYGTSSYAISPHAAKKLISTAKVWFEPVDVHLDRFWTHGVESFGIMPFPVTHVAMSELDSEIWQGSRRGSRSAEFRRQAKFIRLRENFGRFVSNIPYAGRWQE